MKCICGREVDAVDCWIRCICGMFIHVKKKKEGELPKPRSIPDPPNDRAVQATIMPLFYSPRIRIS